MIYLICFVAYEFIKHQKVKSNVRHFVNESSKTHRSHIWASRIYYKTKLHFSLEFACFLSKMARDSAINQNYTAQVLVKSSSFLSKFSNLILKDLFLLLMASFNWKNCSLIYITHTLTYISLILLRFIKRPIENECSEHKFICYLGLL